MVKRKVFSSIAKNLNKKDITLLIGARQVGKTSLLKEITVLLEQKRAEYYFFTLEDPYLLADLNQHPENIFNYIPKKDRQIYLLLDEIQILKNPTNFLKYIYDLYAEHIKLIVTGSSAFYIDKKFKDSLAGRKKIFEIYPFNFSEFILAKGEGKLSEKILDNNFFTRKSQVSFLAPEKIKLKQYLNEYFTFGGYPDVVLEDDISEKKSLLKELHLSFLKKDIYEDGIKEEIKFYQLVNILAAQTGQLVNCNELSNTIGISKDTISKYIYILQKAFIIRLCPPFFSNVRKELTKMPKIYFLDNGYRNSILRIFELIDHRIDSGQALENLFLNELVKAGIDDIRYWRTKDRTEIDFIVNEENAFEIKMQIIKRKKTQFRTFTEKYPDININFVTYLNDNQLDMLDFVS